MMVAPFPLAAPAVQRRREQGGAQGKLVLTVSAARFIGEPRAVGGRAHPLRPEHRRDISRGRRETEAGSVAYVVLAALGLDISSSTVECVADWSHG